VSTRELLPQALPDRRSHAGLFPLAPPSAARQSLNTQTELVTPGLSLRSNFAWILTGNVVYASCQWGAIVALARLGGSFMIGQFSLGLAIATPVLMFTNLHLRAVQATDARRLYSFGEYLRLRTAMTLGGLAVIAGIVCFGNYTRQTALVILTIALAKGIETMSDIHYGLFQLNDRLDQSGRSMMLRGVLSVAALSTGLYLTRNILWGCVGLALVWLAALLFFDVRRGRRFVAGSQGSVARPVRTIRPWKVQGLRRLWSLMRVALPLGIATTMAALNLNIPRYFIHARLGERQLGVYSAMAYATVAMILVSDSLGHCAIPRLSRLYSGGQLMEYRSLLARLLAAGGSFGLAGLAVAQFMGVRLLTLVYGSEYAAHSRIFVMLILATAIYCVACMFTSAITSARRFRIQALVYALVAGSNALACAFWVPAAGLAGGAGAMVLAAVVQLVLGATAVAGLLWAPSKCPACLQESRPCIDDWEARL
jgi:O-antigen/teichoic acid export membrane protein